VFLAEQRLYAADSEDVADVVRETSDEIANVLYIGHNPAAAEIVQQLTGVEPEFPTAAIAVIGVDSDWTDLGPDSSELIASWTPRGTEAAT
jgi:phosphohistidine phosphatase